MSTSRAALGWAIPAIFLLALVIVLLCRRQEAPRPDAPGAGAEIPVTEAPATVEQTSENVVQSASAPEALRLEAEPESFALRVRVVDTEEEPVGEAKVILWNKDGSAPSAWTPARPLESATQADGLCVLNNLPRGTYVLTIVSLRHACRQVEASVPAGEEVLVRLKDAPHLVGQAFLRDKNHPVRFGTIQFASARADGSSYTRLSSDLSTRTDDEARFAVGPFELGEHSIVLAHRQFQLEVLPVKLSAAEPVQEVEVIFKDGILARGNVQNRQGVVLPEERIFWRRAGSDESTRLECRSDAQGRYKQGGLQAGKNIVELFGVALEEGRAQEVVLTEEPIQEVPIVVDCPPSVRVRVVTAAGEPASEAEVIYRFSIPGRGGQFTADPLDAEGWTRIPCAPLGTELLVEAKAAGPVSAKLSHTVSARNDPAILRLDALETLEGDVVGPEGKPAGDLEVSAVEVDLLRADRTRTADDGRFEMTLAPGVYRVEVRAGSRGAAFAEIEIVGGQPPNPLRLELGVDPSQIARVRVVGPDGEPLEGANVELWASSSQLWSPVGLTDKEGWFSTACDKGEYDVMARFGDLVQFESVKLSVPAASVAEVLLEKPEARSVSGVVLLDGKPVIGARLGYGRPDGSWTEGSGGHRVVSDATGQFALNGLNEDAIYVFAWSDKFALARSDIVHLPKRGRVANVLVPALPGKELSLRVEYLDGNPPGHIRVGLLKKDEPPFGWEAPTAGDGMLIVPRLPPGEYTVTFQARSGNYLPSQQLVWAGSASPLTLRLTQPAR